VVHQSGTLAQIFNLNSVLGTGGAPLFFNPGGIAAAPNGYLLGRPIVPIEQASALVLRRILSCQYAGVYPCEKAGLKFDQQFTLILKDEVACVYYP